MEIANFKLSHLAGVMFDQLPAREQSEVVEQLKSLASVSLAKWPTRNIKKIPNEPSLYLVRVNNSMRALLRVLEGQQPEVLDLVRQEALDYFATSQS